MFLLALLVETVENQLCLQFVINIVVGFIENNSLLRFQVISRGVAVNTEVGFPSLVDAVDLKIDE